MSNVTKWSVFQIRSQICTTVKHNFCVPQRCKGQRAPGFLKFLLSECAYVCVHLQAIKNHSCEMNPSVTLAVDITDGCSLSNKARHEFLPKKSKVMLYLLFILQ